MKTPAIISICASTLLLLGSRPAVSAETRVEECLDIAQVPAEFPVGFCLLTAGQHQFVAYYDAGRQMTVASRTLDSDRWQYRALPSKVGWDSHNYLTMAVDDGGHLHLSGNMHCVPLIYFRTSAPFDIATFERIPAMAGSNEDRCTYPRFLHDADGRLVFHYRDGSSGNGREIYNVYDHETRTWRRLLDQPLTDGLGRMNAYLTGPARGPDGWFHLGWVWRDTPDCATNHDPSYARSRDLVRWETAGGAPVRLPITPESTNTRIDPIPAGGGIINGCLKIGFDSAHRPLASYHKFDEKGKTQAYVARFDNGAWTPRQVTGWEYRWEFQGGGSISFEISLGAAAPHAPGRLALPFRHVKHGSGLLILEEDSLRPAGIEKAPRAYPAELSRRESDFPGIQVKTAQDIGESAESMSSRYVLRWETLPQNRDRPREGALPEPSTLRLYKVSAPSENRK